MKNIEIDKINVLVFNYLSLMGLSKDERITKDNPMSKYFYKNIYNIESKNNTTNSIDLSNEEFYKIIYESYRIYKRIDHLLDNQDQMHKNIIKDIIGDDEDIDYYIDMIIEKYKNSLFNILMDYKVNDEFIDNIKIDIFTERMLYYGDIEDYDKAIFLQNIIKKIKGKI